MKRYEGKYTIFETTPAGLNIIRKSSGKCFPIHTQDVMGFIKQVVLENAAELLGSAIHKLKLL